MPIPIVIKKGGYASFFFEETEMNRIVKITLAGALLVCLLDMPYGYFQLIRVVCLIVFGFFAYDCFKTGQDKLGLAFLLLAALFQPFAKIALGRMLWNIVDVVVAVLLVVLVLNEKRV